MKKSIIITTLLIVALVAGNTFAWGPGMGRGTGQGCQGFGGPGTSNLTPEQKDSLSALTQKYVDETYALRAATFQKHQEIRMLMETSAPDRAQLSKLSQELLEVQKQLQDKKIDFALEAKKISPEIGLWDGFGKGRGNGCRDRGQRDCPGQGRGNYPSDNSN